LFEIILFLMGYQQHYIPDRRKPRAGCLAKFLHLPCIHCFQ